MPSNKPLQPLVWRFTEVLNNDTELSMIIQKLILGQTLTRLIHTAKVLLKSLHKEK